VRVVINPSSCGNELFLRFPFWHSGKVMVGGATMEHNRPTPESRLLLAEAAQKELSEFERRENEFRKKDRAERAAELGLPV